MGGVGALNWQGYDPRAPCPQCFRSEFSSGSSTAVHTGVAVMAAEHPSFSYPRARCRGTLHSLPFIGSCFAYFYQYAHWWTSCTRHQPALAAPADDSGREESAPAAVMRGLFLVGSGVPST